MSLIALALRISAVKALQGRTYAEDRVFDSAIAPIDQKIADERKPIVSVYCDEETSAVSGRDLIGAARTIELVLEMAVAAFVPGENGTDVLIPPTDEGAEIALNLMGRQAVRALIDEGTEWSRLFMKFAPSIEGVSSKRGADAENGVRFAARQMTIRCETLCDPPIGPIEAGSPWEDFLTALRADPDLSALADTIEAEIEGPTATSWELAKANFGITRDELRSIGLLPLEPTDAAGDPAEAAAIETIAAFDEDTGATLLIEEDEA